VVDPSKATSPCLNVRLTLPPPVRVRVVAATAGGRWVAVDSGSLELLNGVRASELPMDSPPEELIDRFFKVRALTLRATALAHLTGIGVDRSTGTAVMLFLGEPSMRRSE
jgi:hypothetical protein